MKRKKPLKAVESTAETAAKSGQALIDEAVHRITPLVEQAGDYVDSARKQGAEFASDAYDRVQPVLKEARKRGTDLASDAYERLEPTLKDAYDRVEPTFKGAVAMASDAYERVQPALKEAKKRGAKFAAESLDRVQPALDDALDQVTPVVDAAVQKVRPVVDDTLQKVAPTVDVARDRVQNDFLPWLAAALYKAADLVKEEEIVPTPKRRSVGKTIGLIALAGAVLAGVVYAVRRLMAPQESGWETHEPSRPYVADPVADVVDKASDAADKAKGTAGDAADAAKHAGSEALDKAEDAIKDAKDAADDAKKSAKKAVDDAKGDAAPLAESPYGEGSYVGAEPPEGFDIKGNERSMKYHLQGSGGYERTITDVWFDSTEAAERAGFVRAQR